MAMKIKASDIVLGAAVLGALYIGYRALNKVENTDFTPKINVGMPNISLPSINLPQITMPSLNIPSIPYVSTTAPQDFIVNIVRGLTTSEYTGAPTVSPYLIDNLTSGAVVSTDSGKYLPPAVIPFWVPNERPGQTLQSAGVTGTPADVMTGQSVWTAPQTTVSSAPKTTSVLSGGGVIQIPNSSITGGSGSVVQVGGNSSGGGGTLYSKSVSRVIRADGTREGY